MLRTRSGGRIVTAGLLLGAIAARAAFGLGVTALLIAAGCASLKPKLEVAREDFVQACRDFTSALVGDAHPSQVELIVQKVCLAEGMAERITAEVKQDTADVLAPFPDAGSQR